MQSKLFPALGALATLSFTWALISISGTASVWAGDPDSDSQAPPPSTVDPLKATSTSNRTLKSTSIPKSSPTVESKNDDWKGESELNDFSVGALTGLGLANYTADYALVATISKKIIKRGFVPDINDTVSIELMIGPSFNYVTYWLYSLHLRWDFIKDSSWTFFATGGVGGEIRNAVVYPRFGVGAFYKLNDAWSLRADLSHDLIGIGINFRP